MIDRNKIKLIKLYGLLRCNCLQKVGYCSFNHSFGFSGTVLNEISLEEINQRCITCILCSVLTTANVLKINNLMDNI